MTEASDYAHAGIAAADVICCARLGRHAQGDHHQEAVGLLRTSDADCVRHLETLLKLRTTAGYSSESVTAVELTRSRRTAEHLVESARRA